MADQIARWAARRLLVAALKAEVDDYVEWRRRERDGHRHALMVRNRRAAAQGDARRGCVELRLTRVIDRRHDEHGQRASPTISCRLTGAARGSSPDVCRS